MEQFDVKALAVAYGYVDGAIGGAVFGWNYKSIAKGKAVA